MRILCVALVLVVCLWGCSAKGHANPDGAYGHIQWSLGF